MDDRQARRDAEEALIEIGRSSKNKENKYLEAREAFREAAATLQHHRRRFDAAAERYTALGGSLDVNAFPEMRVPFPPSEFYLDEIEANLDRQGLAPAVTTL